MPGVLGIGKSPRENKGFTAAGPGLGAGSPPGSRGCAGCVACFCRGCGWGGAAPLPAAQLVVLGALC